MKSSTEEIIVRLKNRFSSELEMRPGQRKRNFSSQFKEQLCSEARSNNISGMRLAKGLGISESAIRHWLQQYELPASIKDSTKPLFRKFEIASAPEPEPEPTQAPYMIGKSGVRVMGLSLNQIAELLRCL